MSQRASVTSRRSKITSAALLIAALMAVMAVANGANAVNAASSAASSHTPPLLPGASAAPSAVGSTTSANSLTWTQGRAYPTVSGNAVPPPDAPASAAASSAPQTVGGHWYAGSVSNGLSGTTGWILSEISIPSANTPDSSEFYYVLTSAWDNAASYDQIGFADNYGTWGLTYSYTSGLTTSCTGTLTYHYSPDAKALVAGQEYLLAMTTVSGPGVWFEVYTVSTTGVVSLYWSLHASTGASNPGLELQSFYCGFYNYTDYEEVYGTTAYTQPDPYGAPGGLQFYFHENCYGTSVPCGTYTKWTAWTSGNQPYGTTATIGTYGTANELVTINNYMSLQGYAPG
jgi:hypothetical protein